MDAEAVFARITRHVDDALALFKRSEEAQQSSEQLIATAEYELEQLKKQFAANRLAS